MYVDNIALILKKIAKLLTYEVNLDLSHTLDTALWFGAMRLVLPFNEFTDCKREQKRYV